MVARRGSSPALLIPLLLVAAHAGCQGGVGHGGPAPDSTGSSGAPPGTTSGPTTAPPPSVDSTGAPADPCSDDYDGNHDVASAFVLGLEANEILDTARNVFGDQLIFGVGNERGEDRLVVCPGAPDFFAVEPACAGYLGVDLRRLDDGSLDLHLYAEGTELDRAVGTWNDFYLKPLHHPVSARTYTIEVRHASGGAQPYSLDVYLLAAAPCS